MKKLTLLLAGLLFAIQTHSQTFEVDGIAYNITNSDTVEVTSKTPVYIGNIIIPSAVAYLGTTYNVTRIGEDAFFDCTGLTSITMPNSITSIGAVAFCACSELTSVTIPGSVTSIEEGAFSASGLTSVTIPGSVTSIEEAAFGYCSGLTSVTLDTGVISIGGYAFSNCSGLTSITIPNSVTDIGNGAFENCSGLTSITLGASVTSIKSYTFSGCSGLASITIPNSVTSIGAYAFNGCGRLNSITVEHITPLPMTGSSGFSPSTSDLYVPATSISLYQGDSYWGNFRRIMAIGTTPSITWDIGYCQDSTTCDTVIATLDNTGVMTISGIGKMKGWTSTSSSEIPWDKYHNILTSIVIEQGVTNISDWAFSNCDELVSVAIPNSVTTIGSSAFQECSRLTSIAIPNSVTTIGSSVFRGCSGLTSIAIPNSVTTIGSNAFQECSGLTSIAIPNNVTTIGSSVFYGCSRLASVTIPNSVTSIGSGAFAYSGLTSIIIPNNITNIEEGTFSRCSELASITIPNSVTSIGGGAFFICTKLTSITIPNSVTSIGNDAFSFCHEVDTITIGNSVTSIGTNAFAYCNITSIIIPNSVTTIDNHAFARCSNLRSVYAKSIVPPNCIYTVFENSTKTTGVLYVAKGSLSLYKNAAEWKKFLNIVGIGITLSSHLIDLTINQDTILTYTLEPAELTDRTVVWSSSDTTIVIVDHTGKITAKAAGSAYIIITTQTGGFQDSCLVTVSSIGIKETTEIGKKTLMIYPNPISSQLKIESGELRVNNVQLLDIAGKLVFEIQQTKFDIGHLPKGVYSVKIFTDKGVVLRKIVKQ